MRRSPGWSADWSGRRRRPSLLVPLQGRRWHRDFQRKSHRTIAATTAGDTAYHPLPPLRYDLSAGDRPVPATPRHGGPPHRRRVSAAPRPCRCPPVVLLFIDPTARATAAAVPAAAPCDDPPADPVRRLARARPPPRRSAAGAAPHRCRWCRRWKNALTHSPAPLFLSQTPSQSDVISPFLPFVYDCTARVVVERLL